MEQKKRGSKFDSFAHHEARRTEKNDSNVFNEVRKNPFDARDKVYKMILDQSIDEKLLSTYAYVLSLESEVTAKSEENQAFWRELELNFVQRYQEETDADFNFKVPLGILASYFSVARNLNGPEQCLFPSNTASPVYPLLKRNFLRYSEFETPEEIYKYNQMIQALVVSKALKYISDDQTKNRS